jgi:hypothetical protein
MTEIRKIFSHLNNTGIEVNTNLIMFGNFKLSESALRDGTCNSVDLIVI